MRPLTRAVAAACLLAAPTVLAFFSGGYLTHPRLIAALVVWLLVLSLTVVGPAPVPASTPGRLALAGLGALTVWTALSILWAPVAGVAVQGVQRLLLYVGVMLLAVGALRDARAQRAAEPALAAGVAIVIGHGLTGRLLPDLLELARSKTAGGRLEQPITYWNAEGALAAVGLVLCARIAGDPRRPAWMRIAAAAATPMLGTGVYLTYSRGAIAVGLLGLACLVALAASRAQFRAAIVTLVAGAAGAAWASSFPEVASLSGTPDEKAQAGLLALAGLVVVSGAAAFVARAALRRADDGERLPWARWLGPAFAGLVVAAVLGLVAGGLGERPTQAELAAGAQAGRLTTVSSNRYEYWRVALLALERDPLKGAGSGGFRVLWRQERRIPESVLDVHSLPLEMAAELGLVGLAAWLAWLAGVLLAARRALERDRAMATGWCAAALVWVLHASIDWDWQLPAVTLPAIVLAGGLIALSEAEPALNGR